MAKGSIIMRRLVEEDLPSCGVVIAVHPSNWKHRMSMKSINFVKGKQFRINGTLFDILHLDKYRLTKISLSTERFPYSSPFVISELGSRGFFSKIAIGGTACNAPCGSFFSFVLGKRVKAMDTLWVRAQRINPTKEGD